MLPLSNLVELRQTAMTSLFVYVKLLTIRLGAPIGSVTADTPIEKNN